MQLDLPRCMRWDLGPASHRDNQDTQHLQLPLKLMGIAGSQHHWGFVSRRGICDLSWAHWLQQESAMKTHPWKELKFSVPPLGVHVHLRASLCKMMREPQPRTWEVGISVQPQRSYQGKPLQTAADNSGHTSREHHFDRSKPSWRQAGACG